MSAEFSVEDVRAQLTKLGYVDVPQQVIEKFMSRMKVQQQSAAAAASSAAAAEAAPSSSSPLPPPPSSAMPSNSKPYTSAALPPTVPYVSPLSNLPVSSPVYSSLVQSVTPHLPVSNLPGLPLSLRTNPAFAAQQAAYLPSPSFASSSATAVPAVAQTTFGPAATSKQNVYVEDEEDDDAYINRKNKEIEELEARLKRHAVVAHGFTGISKLGVTSADMASKSPAPVASLKDEHTEVKLTQYRDSPSKENPVESPSKRIGSGRGFGSVRNDNIPAPSLTAAFPSKKIDADLVARAERELRARMATLNLTRAPSAQSLTARVSGNSSSRGRSVERPQSATSHRRESSAPRNTLSRPASAAVIPVVEMDTQRSLRKTYTNSVKKYKGLNPRYGDGGFRKSDPVTRYHAFKSKWDSSHFLNKKTSANPVTNVTTPAPTIGAKAVWRG